jgi:hypothetical protein
MSFNDLLVSDLNNVFFNTDEFAVIREVNGVNMTVIADDDCLKEILGTYKDPEGIYNCDTYFLVRASEYGEKPAPEMPVTYNGEKYLVISADDTGGLMYLIMLGRVGS